MYWICLLLVLVGCSGPEEQLRLGVDPEWVPVDFGAQQPYVNGFVEDVLLDVAGYSGLHFDKVRENWSALFEGLECGRYEAVLSALPPYTFYREKYDFSRNMLPIGPVLIVPSASSVSSMEALEGEFVGVVEGAGYDALAAKSLLRTYPSIPDLCNAVAGGQVAGALCARLDAIQYVRNLFADQLRIATEPLTEAGLRLIVLKDQNGDALHRFDRALHHFQKKHRLQQLQEKWQL